MQQSPEEEKPFVYVTLGTHVTLATAGYTPCLFGYVTIGLARHNRTHFSQSERLLVKPQRLCTDLCAEPAGGVKRNRLQAYRLQIFYYLLLLNFTFSPNIMKNGGLKLQNFPNFWKRGWVLLGSLTYCGKVFGPWVPPRCWPGPLEVVERRMCYMEL